MSRRVYILDGTRTPQGKLGGALKDVSAQALGVHVTKSLLDRYSDEFKQLHLGEVIFGCVAQGSDAPNIARVISLESGVHEFVPAYTVQRNCASGMQAVVSAAQNIMLGQYDVAIAGGTESMSNIPFVNRSMRFGHKMGSVELTDSLVEGLTDPLHNIHMGETAERLADQYEITREEQDEFAALSHARAFAASRQGKFKEEITPIMIEKRMLGKKIGEEPFGKDEGISPKPAKALAKEFAMYPAVFRKGGRVTPANACPINDGAVALMLVAEDFYNRLSDKYGLPEPLGILEDYAVTGVDPTVMGIGAGFAIGKLLLERDNPLTTDSVDLFEINEAFAAQYLAVEKMLELDREKVNVNGGAIALGHPVGCSGARLVLTLLKEMQRQKLHRGVASLCVGGGQGMAVLLKRE